LYCIIGSTLPTLSVCLLGDIVYVNLAGTHAIILNTPEIAIDMLQHKGQIYSDRPLLHFAMELVGWRDNPTFMEEGPRLKESRRLIIKELGPRGLLKKLVPTTKRETKNFLCRVLDDPSSEALYAHIRR
jgi:hypothetical protein